VDMRSIEKIERALIERGLTQGALERAALLPENKLSKWKAGGEPSLSQGLRIARILDVPLAWLADDAQGWPPKTVEAPAGNTMMGIERRMLDLMQRYLEIREDFDRYTGQRGEIPPGSGKTIAEVRMDPKPKGENGGPSEVDPIAQNKGPQSPRMPG
jgi:transcriptional regulator with XRE-family HTH domain